MKFIYSWRLAYDSRRSRTRDRSSWLCVCVYVHVFPLNGCNATKTNSCFQPRSIGFWFVDLQTKASFSSFSVLESISKPFGGILTINCDVLGVLGGGVFDVWMSFAGADPGKREGGCWYRARAVRSRKARKSQGYAHFRWSKTRDNPILCQGKSHS